VIPDQGDIRRGMLEEDAVFVETTASMPKTGSPPDHGVAVHVQSGPGGIRVDADAVAARMMNVWTPWRRSPHPWRRPRQRFRPAGHRAAPARSCGSRWPCSYCRRHDRGFAAGDIVGAAANGCAKGVAAHGVQKSTGDGAWPAFVRYVRLPALWCWRWRARTPGWRPAPMVTKSASALSCSSCPTDGVVGRRPPDNVAQAAADRGAAGVHFDLVGSAAPMTARRPFAGPCCPRPADHAVVA